jgi:hypothetical protein
VFRLPVTNRPSESRGRLRLAGLLVLVATVAAGLLAGSQTAGARSAKVIGATKALPKPSCPLPKKPQKRDRVIPSYKECNAFGHVTGFQLRTAKQRAVSKVKSDGHIVAWSVETSKPRSDPPKGVADERAFFEENLADQTFGRYGGRPVANIAVLKKVRKGRFKLVKQSPIVELDRTLGETPIFTLRKPIRVRKDRIIALTTPTWVTNFALARPSGNAPLSSSNTWRASRKPDRCEGEKNLTKLSKPHVKKGSKRRYGCIYKGAEILYWAYVVPIEKKKK